MSGFETAIRAEFVADVATGRTIAERWHVFGIPLSAMRWTVYTRHPPGEKSER